MRKQPGSQPNEKDFLLAYHIKNLREKKFPGSGSVLQCAEKLGKSYQQYYSWENGTHTPRGSNLEKIEALYGVTRDYFSQKPDNWKSIYDEMLDVWRKRVGAGKAEVKDDEEMAGPPPTVNQALTTQAEVNAIFRLLIEKQAMAENGEIDPETFNEQMRDLHKYMKWSFSK